MIEGCRWEGRDLVLALKVQPRASRDQLVVDSNRLRARITAPPVDGAANTHLIRFLADEFGVNAGRVRLMHGSSSRTKVVRIDAPHTVPESLVSALGAAPSS
jgi:uncharacterized protein (TIGR00251 family)